MSRNDSGRARRLIRAGDTFTVLEDLAGLIERLEADPDPDPPEENVRGEPWGWTKGPPYPRGWLDFAAPPYPRGWREPGDDGPDA